MQVSRHPGTNNLPTSPRVTTRLPNARLYKNANKNARKINKLLEKLPHRHFPESLFCSYLHYATPTDFAARSKIKMPPELSENPGFRCFVIPCRPLPEVLFLTVAEAISRPIYGIRDVDIAYLASRQVSKQKKKALADMGTNVLQCTCVQNDEGKYSMQCSSKRLWESCLCHRGRGAV
jgi:hypothetical protein